MTWDNIAIQKITDYQEWWNRIGKKTRNMIRKALKRNVKILDNTRNDKITYGIWKIYNETPIRQRRRYIHYGITLKEVKNSSTIQKEQY